MSRLAVICTFLVLVVSARADGPSVTPKTDVLPAGAILRVGSLRWRATGPIAVTAYLEGGKQILTVGTDRNALVWDAESGREARRFEIGGGTGPNIIPDPDGGLGRFIVSSNGKTLAHIAQNRWLRVVDVATGKETRRIDNFAENQQIALSPDGRSVAAVDQNGRIRIWRTSGADKPRVLNESESSASGRAFTYRLEYSADGKSLIQIGMNYESGVRPNIAIWDVERAKRIHELSKLPDGAEENVILKTFPSPDLKSLFFPVGSSLIRVNAADGKELTRLKEIDSPEASAFLQSANGQELIQVAGRGELVVVWDSVKGTVSRRFGKLADRTNLYPPQGLSLSPDGKTLALGDGASVSFIDLQSGKMSGGNEGHSTPLFGAYYSPDGKTILTRAERTYIRWDASNSKFLERFDAPGDHSTFLISRDSKWIVATGLNATLHVYEVATRKEKHVIPLGINSGYTFTVAPDSNTLIVLGRPAHALLVFDLTTGEPRTSLPLPPYEASREDYAGYMPRRLTTTRDSRFVAGSTESHVLVWDLNWQREVQRVPIPAGKMLRHIMFGPDGRTLAIEFYGGEIGIWEVASGTRRRLLTEGEKTATNFNDPNVRMNLDGSRLPAALSYSIDGRFVANAGANRKIRLWDARFGQEVGMFEGHRGPITGVSFNPETTRMVSACADTTALVWDLSPIRAKLRPLTASTDFSGPALWEALLQADGEKAYDAILNLAGDPARSIPFLRERLKPIPLPDEKLVLKLVAEMESPKYATRIKAQRELERLGELAIPALKEAMDNGGTAEVRAQARKLLEKMSIRTLSQDQLRHIRAAEALEIINTPEARTLLTELAAGAPASPLTIEAKTALERLTAK